METPHMAERAAYSLDPRLAADTHPVLSIGLCTLLLKDDSRWPWLILVPQRANMREVHDLTPLDQAMLSFETTLVSEMLARLTGCHKINTGALGNVVEQLHIHVVARNIGDANWPGPVWGHGASRPYAPDAAQGLISRMRQAF
ncbi:MAG: HIT family protein [Rhizobiaceae bacterium]|nr:HIT family protein [Rhizobiaceae bacterium]